MEDLKNFYVPLLAATKSILSEHNDIRGYFRREWTCQGFGMIRTYLDPDKVWRLNVWHDAFKVPNVSVIHDHPWHFDSWILGGVFDNQRYHITDDFGSKPMHYFTIKTGVDHNPATDRGEIKNCRLKASKLIEHYEPGDFYHQDAEEIHETVYRNYCVTINRRTRVGTGEHARVFWPAGEDWVDAKPRVVEHNEIAQILNAAWLGLDGWPK